MFMFIKSQLIVIRKCINHKCNQSNIKLAKYEAKISENQSCVAVFGNFYKREFNAENFLIFFFNFKDFIVNSLQH